jgi:hypothetical protein
MVCPEKLAHTAKLAGMVKKFWLLPVSSAELLLKIIVVSEWTALMVNPVTMAEMDSAVGTEGCAKQLR